MTLYEMKNQELELTELLRNGDIDEQTFADTVESLGTEDKLQSLGYVLRTLEAEAQMQSDTAKFHAEKAKRAESAASRIKDYVKLYLTSTGQTKANAGLFCWSLRTSKAVAITDESAVPVELFRIKTEPDKTAIRELLDTGETVPGACIEERFSAVLK